MKVVVFSPAAAPPFASVYLPTVSSRWKVDMTEEREGRKTLATSDATKTE